MLRSLFLNSPAILRADILPLLYRSILHPARCTRRLSRGISYGTSPIDPPAADPIGLLADRFTGRTAYATRDFRASVIRPVYFELAILLFLGGVLSLLLAHVLP